MIEYATVEYRAEQIGIRELLTGTLHIDDIIEDACAYRLEEFAEKHGGVLIDDRTKFSVQSEIRMKRVKVWAGILPFWRDVPTITHVLHVTGWMWVDVAPAHREQLKHLRVRDNELTVRMLTASLE